MTTERDERQFDLACEILQAAEALAIKRGMEADVRTSVVIAAASVIADSADHAKACVAFVGMVASIAKISTEPMQ